MRKVGQKRRSASTLEKKEGRVGKCTVRVVHGDACGRACSPVRWPAALLAAVRFRPAARHSVLSPTAPWSTRDEKKRRKREKSNARHRTLFPLCLASSFRSFRLPFAFPHSRASAIPTPPFQEKAQARAKEGNVAEEKRSDGNHVPSCIICFSSTPDAAFSLFQSLRASALSAAGLLRPCADTQRVR